MLGISTVQTQRLRIKRGGGGSGRQSTTKLTF